MNSARLVQLVVIGELAMDQWRAQELVDNAKHRYHRAIGAYEAKHGHLSRLIRKDDPEHAAVREFTAAEYKLMQQARRRVYALKGRMAKACAKLARLNAERA